MWIKRLWKQCCNWEYPCNKNKHYRAAIGWIPLKAYFIFFGILFIGLTIALTVYFVSKADEEQRIEDEFSASANDIRLKLEESFGIVNDKANTLSYLFRVHPSMTVPSFLTFATGIFSSTIGLQAAAYTSIVPESDRLAFLNFSRSIYGEQYQFYFNDENGVPTVSNGSDLYAPILYIYPMDDVGSTLLGLDLYRDTIITEALLTSAETGELSMTRKFLGPFPESWTIIIVGPVFGDGTDPSVNTTGVNVTGHGGAQFLVEDVVEGTMALFEQDEITFALFETDPADPTDPWLYTHVSKDDKASRFSDIRRPNQMKFRDLRVSRILRIANREWLFVAVNNPDYVTDRETFVPEAFLITILAITVLLLIYIIFNLVRYRFAYFKALKAEEENEMGGEEDF